MSLISGFNAENVEPHGSFEPLPAGQYAAVITNGEEKSTRNGNGQYLQLEFEIIDGDFKGRKLWTRLNLINPSDKAVAMARAELSSICRTVGVMCPQDTPELFNIPLTLSVIAKKDDDGEIRNYIRGYDVAGGAKSKPAAAPAAPQTPQKAPWAR